MTKHAFSTVVYGDEYWFTMFQEFLIPSLLQPGNIPAMAAEGVNMSYSIYSSEASAARIERAIRETNLERYVELRFRFVPSLDRENKAFRHSMGVSALIDQIRHCLDEGRTAYMCAPDMVVGDGTISNLLRIHRPPGTCLGGAYLRSVDTELMELIRQTGFPMAPETLVTLIMKSLNRDCLEARVELGARNSYYTGLSLQHIGDTLYGATMRAPTIQLADFTESDLRFFEYHKDFRAYDHYWPGKLVAENRFRLLASSDLSLAVEMTPKDKGGRNDLLSVGDDYIGVGAHNLVCGNYVYTMRSSEPVDLDEVARRRGLPVVGR